MSSSKLVGTSSSTRTLDERDLSSLRPAKQNAPRRRKPTVLREVTNGIACFCGERFGESQALEFMLHLRAEFGEELARVENWRARDRKYSRERRKDPDVRERRRESGRRYDRQRAQDPAARERKREYDRMRAKDPVARQRKRKLERERRAQKKAGLEAATGEGSRS